MLFRQIRARSEHTLGHTGDTGHVWAFGTDSELNIDHVSMLRSIPLAFYALLFFLGLARSSVAGSGGGTCGVRAAAKRSTTKVVKTKP